MSQKYAIFTPNFLTDLVPSLSFENCVRNTPQNYFYQYQCLFKIVLAEVQQHWARTVLG